MKVSDYISVISIAVFGTIIAYFLMNGILGDPKDKVVKFEYLASSTSELVAPDSEIFNSGAINPTVEVYIGTCRDLNGNGVIDREELVECGEDQEFSDGATTTTQSEADEFYQRYGMTQAENEEINAQEGYAAGTTPDQRQNVNNQVEEYAQQQQQQNVQGGTNCDYNGDGVVSPTELETCNANNPARQETTSE